jgi:hypothetical protein
MIPANAAGSTIEILSLYCGVQSRKPWSLIALCANH